VPHAAATTAAAITAAIVIVLMTTYLVPVCGCPCCPAAFAN
jgi:hypothetical protein